MEMRIIHTGTLPANRKQEDNGETISPAHLWAELCLHLKEFVLILLCVTTWFLQQINKQTTFSCQSELKQEAFDLGNNNRLYIKPSD